MTTTDKIQTILDNADSCHYRIEQVIAIVTNPESPMPGGVAEWLRKIGVDDERIEPALDEALSPEARGTMFRGLMEKYHLNNQATAALLGCSVPAIASYRTGRNPVPIRRLMQLQRIVEAIDAARQ